MTTKQEFEDMQHEVRWGGPRCECPNCGAPMVVTHSYSGVDEKNAAMELEKKVMIQCVKCQRMRWGTLTWSKPTIKRGDEYAEVIGDSEITMLCHKDYAGRWVCEHMTWEGLKCFYGYGRGDKAQKLAVNLLTRGIKHPPEDWEIASQTYCCLLSAPPDPETQIWLDERGCIPYEVNTFRLSDLYVLAKYYDQMERVEKILNDIGTTWEEYEKSFKHCLSKDAFIDTRTKIYGWAKKYYKKLETDSVFKSPYLMEIGSTVGYTVNKDLFAMPELVTKLKEEYGYTDEMLTERPGVRGHIWYNKFGTKISLILTKTEEEYRAELYDRYSYEDRYTNEPETWAFRDQWEGF